MGQRKQRLRPTPETMLGISGSLNRSTIYLVKTLGQNNHLWFSGAPQTDPVIHHTPFQSCLGGLAVKHPTDRSTLAPEVLFPSQSNMIDSASGTILFKKMGILTLGVCKVS